MPTAAIDIAPASCCFDLDVTPDFPIRRVTVNVSPI
jgi:hypothetical protein